MVVEQYLRVEQIVGTDRMYPVPLDTHAKPAHRRKTARPHYPPIVNVSRSAWWAGVKAGKYPQSLKLGPRTTVWRASEIYAIGNAK